MLWHARATASAHSNSASSPPPSMTGWSSSMCGGVRTKLESLKQRACMRQWQQVLASACARVKMRNQLVASHHKGHGLHCGFNGRRNQVAFQSQRLSVLSTCVEPWIEFRDNISRASQCSQCMRWCSWGSPTALVRFFSTELRREICWTRRT